MGRRSRGGTRQGEAEPGLTRKYERVEEAAQRGEEEEQGEGRSRGSRGSRGFSLGTGKRRSKSNQLSLHEQVMATRL